MKELSLDELEQRVIAAEAARVGPPRDLHREKAAELFGIPVDQVTPEQRRSGKAANFAEWYGAEPSSPEYSRLVFGTPGWWLGNQS